MGFWNYRVFVETYPNGEQEFSIRETHYPSIADPAQATVKGLAYSRNPSPPGGETLAELEDSLKLMLKALQKPVLEDARDLADELGE